MGEVNNRQDVLDSRDIQKRIDELESDINLLKDELEELLDEAEEDRDTDRIGEIEEEIVNIKSELKPLLELADAGIPDWKYGTTLIHEDYWVKFVQDICEDISGPIPDYIVVDWEATADNIAQDYSQIDYDGETYYYRS